MEGAGAVGGGVAEGSNSRLQVPNLSQAMWRNFDATEKVAWKSLALQGLKKDRGDLRQRYGEDLMAQTVKEMKAEEEDGVQVWKGAWRDQEHGILRRLPDRRSGREAVAAAPRRRMNTKTYVLQEDSESSEGIGDTGEDAGPAIGGEVQVAGPTPKRARRELQGKEFSHWQNCEHSKWKVDLKRHFRTSPAYGLDNGLSVQD